MKEELAKALHCLLGGSENRSPPHLCLRLKDERPIALQRKLEKERRGNHEPFFPTSVGLLLTSANLWFLKWDLLHLSSCTARLQSCR